jgi:hypothetical protein
MISAGVHCQTGAPGFRDERKHAMSERQHPVVAAWAPIALELLRWSGNRAAIPPPVEAGQPYLEILRKRRVESLLYLANRTAPPQQAVYDRYWLRQRQHHLALLEELGRRGIPAITFKGAEFVARSYDNRSLCFLADVDLLVERAALLEVKNICHNLGWRQANLDASEGRLDELDLVEVAQSELNHYELVPYRLNEAFEVSAAEEEFVGQWSRPPIWPGEAGLARAFFKLDVHWKPVVDVDAGPLFARAVPSSLGIGLTFGPADHVWLTLAKLYFEVSLLGKRYLRDFAYVAPIIANEAIDWDVVLQAHRDNNLGPGLFYYLSFLSTLNPPGVPAEILDSLDPRNNGHSNRDWGWQLSQLFGGLDAFPLWAGPSDGQ